LAKAVKITIIALASLLTLFVLMVGYLSVGRANDNMLHKVHLSRLEKIYEDGHTPLDDSVFADFDPVTSTLHFNHIRMLATHNSYKKTGSDLGKLLVGLGDSFEMADALRYGYNDLATQLDSGIRSMEWDIRLRRGRFELTHVPLVDSRSVAPVMENALEEISLWSENNPAHLPLVILIEIKTDWMVLDPFLEDITDDDLQGLDDMVGDVLGDALVRPSDLMAEGLSLMETVTSQGWPMVRDMLGKVAVVLHPSQFTEPYVNLDLTLQSQAMFPAVYDDATDRAHAAFVIHNDPVVESIRALVDRGFVVRTRVDADLVYTDESFDDAIRSGAQILSSDFTIGRSDLDRDLMIAFEGGLTVTMIKFEDT
jgi:hypothetical protein